MHGQPLYILFSYMSDKVLDNYLSLYGMSKFDLCVDARFLRMFFIFVCRMCIDLRNSEIRKRIKNSRAPGYI